MVLSAVGTPEIALGGAGAVIAVGLAWLRWLSTTQTRTFESLMSSTSTRMDLLEKENRGLRISQKWCDHRFSESMRAIQMSRCFEEIVIPAEFYQDEPPLGGWPRIPPPRRNVPDA